MTALDGGIEIRRLAPNDLIEQDVNARYMTSQMFDRLTTTIKRDNRLETLPYCAATEKGIEIISGHHRVRAARAAEIPAIYVLVDTSGLTADQIRAKQLAHNAIGGRDNEELLRQIYAEIRDAEAKLEAFIDLSLDDVEVAEVPIENVQVDLNVRSVLLTFLPSEQRYFERIADTLVAPDDALYLAERAGYEPFLAILRKTQRVYDIRSVGTALTRMAEICGTHLGDEPDSAPGGLTSVFDIVGKQWVGPSAAAALTATVQTLKKSGAL